MSYEKLGFVKGQVLKADHLNHIEDGIANAGGADWNAAEGEPGHVLNRTHYEEVVQAFEPIAWDGSNKASLETAYFMDSTYYKLSAQPVDVEYVETVVIGATQNGTHQEVDALGAGMVSKQDSSWAVAPFILSSDGQLMVDGDTIPKGIWGLDATEQGLIDWKFTINPKSTTTLKTIDHKYLPEALQFGEEKAFEPIVWDGNTEGLESFIEGSSTFYKVHDKYIPREDLESLSAVSKVNGATEKVQAEQFTDTAFGWSDSNSTIVCVKPDADSIVLSEGLWFVSGIVNQMASVTINPAPTVKPLDEKFMPILTSPGGKKFRIAVADDGTLSATEV